MFQTMKPAILTHSRTVLKHLSEWLSSLHPRNSSVLRSEDEFCTLSCSSDHGQGRILSGEHFVNESSPSGDNATLDEARIMVNTSIWKLWAMRFLITDTPRGDGRKIWFLEFPSAPDVRIMLIVTIARSGLWPHAATQKTLNTGEPLLFVN